MRQLAPHPEESSMPQMILTMRWCSDLWLKSLPATHSGCMALLAHPWWGLLSEMPQIRRACQRVEPACPSGRPSLTGFGIDPSISTHAVLMKLVRRDSSPVDEEDFWERLGLDNLDGVELLWPVAEPRLKLLPERDPELLVLVSSTCILLTKFYVPYPVRNELGDSRAQIHGVICVHVWLLSIAKEQASVLGLGAGGEPFRGRHERALRTIRDECATKIWRVGIPR